MKRVLSMLVAMAMILSMVPAVFAASETATVIEDISTIAVELNADNGYYAEYSWTPSEDGELSLYQYTEKDIEVTLTQGDNSATSYTDENYSYAVSMEVVAGEEVIIEVINSVEEDETFEITGNFVGAQGKNPNNPIMLNDRENTVTNTGTLWYGGYFSSMELTIVGENDFVVTHGGTDYESFLGEATLIVSSPNPRMPVTFAITGEGEFSLTFNYPLGSMENPAALQTGMANYAAIAAGSQGYNFAWTAPAAGTLSLSFYAEDADWNELGWSYAVHNMTTYAYGDTQWSDSDPVINPTELTVAAGDEIQVIANTYDPANPWNAPAGDLYVTANFVCAEHGSTYVEDNYDSLTHNVICAACGTVLANEEHTYVDGTCVCSATQPGTEINPHDLTNDLIYDGDFTATVTVPANTTYYCMAYGVNGMTMTINGGEPVVCTSMGRMPYSWTLVNDSAEAAEYVIVVEFPLGSMDNPAEMTTGMANYAAISEGSQGYNFTWTAPAAGTLTLSFYAEDADWNPLGWTYTVNNLTTYAYGDTQWSDSDPVVNPTELTVAAGDEIQVIANTYDPANPWTAPAGDLYVTANFACTEHGTTYVEDNYDSLTHNVICADCGTVLANEEHTYVDGTCACSATQPGTETNPHDLTNDLIYDGDFTATVTVPANTTYYCMAYRVGGMLMTINGGAPVECTTQGMMMPYTWTIVNDSDEAAQYTIVVAAPIGTMDNPEILFRPNSINVNIAEGNNQGYYYKWTSNAEGSLKLTCPTVEGVNYDVIMLNKNTYQQKWLQDSTDGTVSLDVKPGDEVIIQIAVMPDAQWNIPALQTTLRGEFVFPLGSSMNPEIIESLEWTCLMATQAEGSMEGYTYSYTAPEDGVCTFYFANNEALENYTLDILVTNMNTYAQMSLLQDGVDNYGLELQVPVKAGNELMIQIIAIKDAEGNYSPAAEMEWWGNFTYPMGSEKNPIYIEWNWNDEYSAATASVTVEAGVTAYYSGVNGMILTANGAELEMNAEGVFCLSNTTDAAVTYELALATPVGAYNNPEVIESLPFTGSESLGENGSYSYIWTATEDTTVVLDITDGANLTAEILTYVEDSEWPIAEQFELATPTIDENWNYIGWDVAENLTLEVKAGQQLKLQIQGLTDWSDWSVPAIDYTLTIEGTISKGIIAQPENITVNSGGNAQFTVETVGEVVSYKWQYKKLHVWFDTTMTGYNTNTLTVAATGARNNYAYRCIVTFADGTKVISDAAVMTVNTVITITGNPNDQLVALGYKGQFTVAAEGEGLKYQWEYKRPGSDLWIDTAMEGATKPTVMIETTTARDGYEYRCKITDAAGAVVYSEAATMTVLSFTQNPADVRTAEGAKVTFTVATNEAPVSYQWQYSRNNGQTWTNTTMTGYNTDTLTVDAIASRNGYLYRCVVTGAKSSEVASKSAVLNIGSAAEITSQPENVTAAVGNVVKFAVAANNAHAYQWQYSRNGGASWLNTNMTGATTAELSVEVLNNRNGYQYRCMITGTDGTVIYTDAATLTVG